MTDPTSLQYENSPTGPAVSLGFFGIGFFSLCAALGILELHPGITLGDPYRTEALGFAALVGLGFVGSFVFAAAYMVSPVMAGGRLFSDRVAAAHLLLHAVGLGWLIVVFGGMEFLEAPKTDFTRGSESFCLGRCFTLWTFWPPLRGTTAGNRSN